MSLYVFPFTSFLCHWVFPKPDGRTRYLGRENPEGVLHLNFQASVLHHCGFIAFLAELDGHWQLKAFSLTTGVSLGISSLG